MDHSYKVTLQNRLTGSRQTYKVQAENGRDAMRSAFRQLRNDMDNSVIPRASFGDYHLDRVESSTGGNLTNLL